MGLRVLAADGAEVTPIMGSYGIGIERILSSAIEQNHDDDGMFLPASIAPFHGDRDAGQQRRRRAARSRARRSTTTASPPASTRSTTIATSAPA